MESPKQKEWLDLIREAIERRIIVKDIKTYTSGRFYKRKDGTEKYSVQRSSLIRILDDELNDYGWNGLRSYQKVVLIDEENFLSLIRFLLNSGHIDDIVDDKDMEYLKEKIGFECKTFDEAWNELTEKYGEL